MAAKDKSPAEEQKEESGIHGPIPVSIRLHPGIYAWLMGTCQDRGISVGAGIRELIDDYRDWYGLPRQQVEALEADCKASGQTRREYLKSLLSARYTDLVIEKMKAEWKDLPQPK
jgi:hypothetical protein